MEELITANELDPVILTVGRRLLRPRPPRLRTPVYRADPACAGRPGPAYLAITRVFRTICDAVRRLAK